LVNTSGTSTIGVVNVAVSSHPHYYIHQINTKKAQS